MTAPKPYLNMPGNARDALTFYQQVFGGELTFHTFIDFGRTDGPETAIAHGVLDGPVSMYASDAAEGEESFTAPAGLMFALLGAADPATLTRWFGQLADGGTVVDDLQERGWNASDGQVQDRFGIHWLIGFEH